MTLAAVPSTLAIAVPSRTTYLIRITGEFDRLTGTRVLRLIDARLHLRSLGSCATEHVLIDFAGVQDVRADALPTLRHAEHACRRREVSVGLVGTAALAPHLSAAVRAQLGHYRSYPSLDAALAELGD